MKTKTTKKFTRSNNRMLAGVLGGIAEYFNWNPTIVRAVFVALLILPGVRWLAIALYLLAVVLVPNSSDHPSFFDMFRDQGSANAYQSNRTVGRKIIRNVHEENEPHQHK